MFYRIEIVANDFLVVGDELWRPCFSFRIKIKHLILFGNIIL
jgi:hypothetical protein